MSPQRVGIVGGGVLGLAGHLVDDFRITRHGRMVDVRNAPSPAATSSLAIADHIIDGLALD